MSNPFDSETTDDIFSIDLDSVKSDIIPKGEYPVECMNIVDGVSKSSGDKMWTWSFEICQGEYAGRKLSLYTVLSPSALPILKRTLIALGLYDEEKGGKQNLSKSQIIGSRAMGVIDHEKYNGEDRHKLKGLKKWDGAAEDEAPF